MDVFLHIAMLIVVQCVLTIYRSFASSIGLKAQHILETVRPILATNFHILLAQSATHFGNLSGFNPFGHCCFR